MKYNKGAVLVCDLKFFGEKFLCVMHGETKNSLGEVVAEVVRCDGKSHEKEIIHYTHLSLSG